MDPGHWWEPVGPLQGDGTWLYKDDSGVNSLKNIIIIIIVGGSEMISEW